MLEPDLNPIRVDCEKSDDDDDDDDDDDAQVLVTEITHKAITYFCRKAGSHMARYVSGEALLS